MQNVRPAASIQALSMCKAYYVGLATNETSVCLALGRGQERWIPTSVVFALRREHSPGRNIRNINSGYLIGCLVKRGRVHV
jgi:hypothetical protein